MSQSVVTEKIYNLFSWFFTAKKVFPITEEQLQESLKNLKHVVTSEEEVMLPTSCESFEDKKALFQTMIDTKEEEKVKEFVHCVADAEGDVVMEECGECMAEDEAMELVEMKQECEASDASDDASDESDESYDTSGDDESSVYTE